jgi:hypothetical protein
MFTEWKSPWLRAFKQRYFRIPHSNKELAEFVLYEMEVKNG